jgi:small-conductance mechanosensitive channel
VQLDVRAGRNAEAERVIELLNAVAANDARVSDAPPPETLLLRFDDDATVFRLCFWAEGGWSRLRSDLAIAAQRAIRAEGLDGGDTR